MLLSLRVGFGLWHDARRRAQLVQLLADYRDVVEEVWLFTAFEHGLQDLSEISRRCEVLAEALDQIRQAGLRAGINHLATAGHGSETVSHPLDQPWQPLVGIDGRQGGYCFSDERFLDHVREAYRILARTNPDFIWIDDDVRMENRAKVGLTCFCPRCLGEFSRRTQRNWTRESLVRALDDPQPQRAIAVRRQWLERNREHLAGLLGAIAQAIEEIQPAMPIGFMSAEISYSGYGHSHWARALGSHGQRQVMWRPGHGFYTDDKPRDLLAKSASVARQLTFLPPEVTNIQYEHESFPHQYLDKSQSIFAAECVAAAAVGCSGVALNCLPMSESDPLDEYVPRFDLLRSRRDQLDTLIAARRGRRPSGLWLAMTADRQAYLASGASWDKAPQMGRDLDYFQQMFSCGLSQAYRRQEASVHLLTRENVCELPDESLKQALGKAAFVDADALETLMDRGMGDLVGFEPARRVSEDGTERFTSDPINAPFAGRHRNCRKWFCGGSFQLLRPRPGARPLSYFIDYHGRERAVASGVFENEQGGRVYLSGYYPWIRLLSQAKYMQTRKLMRWLSGDRIDGWVDSFHRTALWTYACEDECDLAVVMNVSLDDLSEVHLLLRHEAKAVECVESFGSSRRIESVGRDGPYNRYVIDRLDSWQSVILQTCAEDR
jgi:hypothetical protein